MDIVFQRLAGFVDGSWQSFVNVLDILLVAFLVYKLLILVRGRRAWNVIIGILFFALALFFSELLGLRTLNWILDKATLLAPVALVLLFLPELRQAIEGFAKVGSWSGKLLTGETALGRSIVDEIVVACDELASTQTGALIVIERQSKLTDVVANGVPVMGTVTSELLVAIFYEGNPLHDGAAVICGDKLMAAACRLPLSESTRLGNKYHMRHRAGLGMSEVADSVVVIVSEERGAISLALAGKLEHMENSEGLRERLTQEFTDVDKAEEKRLRSILRKSSQGEKVAK